MDKLKGYAGILIAAGLLALAFTPAPRPQHLRQALPVAPLESTVLTRLTVEQSTPMQVWVRATSGLKQWQDCLNLQEQRSGTTSERDCGGGFIWHQMLTSGTDVGSAVGAVLPFEPALDSLLAEYVDTKPNTLRRHELDLLIGTAVSKYLDAERPGLAKSIATVHIVFVLLIALMVWWRRQVGSVVLSPLALLFGIDTASAKGAKALHDKI